MVKPTTNSTFFKLYKGKEPMEARLMLATWKQLFFNRPMSAGRDVYQLNDGYFLVRDEGDGAKAALDFLGSK